jgi:hypothetical protein
MVAGTHFNVDVPQYTTAGSQTLHNINQFREVVGVYKRWRNIHACLTISARESQPEKTLAQPDIGNCRKYRFQRLRGFLAINHTITTTTAIKVGFTLGLFQQASESFALNGFLDASNVTERRPHACRIRSWLSRTCSWLSRTSTWAS